MPGNENAVVGDYCRIFGLQVIDCEVGVLSGNSPLPFFCNCSYAKSDVGDRSSESEWQQVVASCRIVKKNNIFHCHNELSIY